MDHTLGHVMTEQRYYIPPHRRGQKVLFFPPSAVSLSSYIPEFPVQESSPTRQEQRPFGAFSEEREMLNGHVRQLCRMRAQKAATGSKDEFVLRGCGGMEGDPSGHCREGGCEDCLV